MQNKMQCKKEIKDEINNDIKNRIRNKIRSKIIGITGNSGSGKTTVANMIGGHAIDADKVAHRVMEPGQVAYLKIVSAFGSEILDSDNFDKKIDRKKLGNLVFNDTSKRTLLEDIVHPIVIDEILDEINRINETNEINKNEINKSEINKIKEFQCVMDSPELTFAIDAVLLVESGLHHYCDAVWLVSASPELRLNRIISRDNLSEEAAQSRMRNQRDTAHIAAIADAIIVNDGDFESLKSQIINESERFGLCPKLC